MPKVEKATARKDYPNAGIKKGDEYFHWTPYRGQKQRSKTYPRPSQLTGSDKLQRIYEAGESVEDFCANWTPTTFSDVQALVDLLNESANNVREVADEYQSAADNMNGNEQHQERADAAGEYADALENAASDIEGMVEERKGELAEDAKTDAEDGAERDEDSLGDDAEDWISRVIESASEPEFNEP